MMPFGLAFLILGHYVFKRRFEKIERKYEGRKMVTFWNTVIVFSVMLVPLIISIILLKKEQGVALLDTAFGAAGFIPGYGWAVSGAYFLIVKPLYKEITKP